MAAARRLLENGASSCASREGEAQGASSPSPASASTSPARLRRHVPWSANVSRHKAYSQTSRRHRCRAKGGGGVGPFAERLHRY